MSSNLLLDDRNILIQCLDGDIIMGVRYAVTSKMIKEYIEHHDESKDTSELHIQLNYTREEFTTSMKPFMPKIEEYLMLPKFKTCDEIYQMNEKELETFINTSEIKIEKFDNYNSNILITLNNVTCVFYTSGILFKHSSTDFQECVNHYGNMTKNHIESLLNNRSNSMIKLFATKN